MNVFISGPALTSERLFSVCETEVEEGPSFLFLFWGFQAENQNYDTNIAINHNLWSWLFSWENRFFSNLKKIVNSI